MTFARRMLDTNIVGHILKGNPTTAAHLVGVPMASLCISVITEGELLFGLAKRPEAKKLHLVIREFLPRVEILGWDSAAAETYGDLRASLENSGKTLSSLDLLIAAHALAANAILVTSDKAFGMVKKLKLEDWTKPAPQDLKTR